VNSESREKPAGDSAISIDAAVAEEGPVAANFFHLPGIAFDDQDLFPIMRCFGENAAEWVTDKRGAPEFETPIGGSFEADTIDGCDVNSIGNGVGALDGFPGVVLGSAELGFLRGMPADGGGVEQNVCAGQGREAGGFGIPLIPADESRDAPEVSKARKPRSPGVK